MPKKYPPNPIWIEERLEELLSLIEGYGWSAFIDRQRSYFKSVYVTVWVPKITSAGKPVNTGKMLNSKICIRVADHPPRNGMEASIHPDGDSVESVFGREKRAYRKRMMAKAHNLGNVIQRVGKRMRRSR